MFSVNNEVEKSILTSAGRSADSVVESIDIKFGRPKYSESGVVCERVIIEHAVILLLMSLKDNRTFETTYNKTISFFLLQTQKDVFTHISNTFSERKSNDTFLRFHLCTCTQYMHKNTHALLK